MHVDILPSEQDSASSGLCVASPATKRKKSNQLTPTQSDEPAARPLLKSGKRYVAINSGAGDWLRLLVGKSLGLGDGLQRRSYRLIITQQVQNWLVSTQQAASGIIR